MKPNNDSYMVVLHEKTLTSEIKPFQDGIEILHKEIKCQTIDHATAIDVLEENDIDMWVDDEGLLVGRLPVMMFADETGRPTGQIVGNVVFETSDDQGESHGMSLEMAQTLVRWLERHQVAEIDSGLLYGGEPTNDNCRFYVIREWETEKVRNRIADMKKWAEDNGWQVLGM